MATVTIIASYLFLPQTVWITTIKQAAAARFCVENWSQALISVDYLADRSSASPFQHYWALSVQGQFYFLWPFLMAFLVLAQTSPISTMSLPANMGVVDFTEFLCTSDECFPAAGKVLIYRDRHHISKAYVLTLAPFLEQQLQTISPELVISAEAQEGQLTAETAGREWF